MAIPLSDPPPLAPATRLLASASIEVSPRTQDAAETLRDLLPPGTEAFINFVPGSDFRRSIALAASLRAGGFEPVPHLTARHLASQGELDDALARLAGEAGVTRVFCIGGDVAVPRGPFASARDVMSSGALPAHGITTVGFAGYPEGHHIVAPAVIEAALAGKLASAREQRLDAFIVTQLCFEAAPILDWLGGLRAGGITAPVRIGIAGPTSIRTLLTFAMRCGVGPSLRMLLNQPQSIGRLLRDASQDQLADALDAALATMPGAGDVGFHLFPFGGLAKAAAWSLRARQ